MPSKFAALLLLAMISVPAIANDEIYTSLVNAYQSDINEAKARLDACPQTHVTRCIAPEKAFIARLNGKLNEIKAIYAKINEAKARLETCPQTHVTRCIAPEKALINSLSKEH